MARTTPACQSDLACFRNDGHPGECMYPTSSGHVHKGEWCEACVQHGVTLAATPAPLDPADQFAGALEIAANDVEALPCIDRRLNTDWVSRRAVLAILRRPLAATPAPLDADRLARALTEVQGGALDSWMGRAPLIAAAYAEEPHGG